LLAREMQADQFLVDKTPTVMNNVELGAVNFDFYVCSRRHFSLFNYDDKLTKISASTSVEHAKNILAYVHSWGTIYIDSCPQYTRTHVIEKMSSLVSESSSDAMGSQSEPAVAESFKTINHAFSKILDMTNSDALNASESIVEEKAHISYDGTTGESLSNALSLVCLKLAQIVSFDPSICEHMPLCATELCSIYMFLIITLFHTRFNFEDETMATLITTQSAVIHYFGMLVVDSVTCRVSRVLWGNDSKSSTVRKIKNDFSMRYPHFRSITRMSDLTQHDVELVEKYLEQHKHLDKYNLQSFLCISNLGVTEFVRTNVISVIRNLKHPQNSDPEATSEQIANELLNKLSDFVSKTMLPNTCHDGSILEYKIYGVGLITDYLTSMPYLLELMRYNNINVPSNISSQI
jgi:hypothetical protein